MHFDDQQIAKVLAQLRQQHLLDNTIVILSSDHGQQFNENGLNCGGHSSNFTPYQTRKYRLLFIGLERNRKKLII